MVLQGNLSKGKNERNTYERLVTMADNKRENKNSK